MFSNVALDVVIGLIFIFLLYSLLATILAEIIATIFAFRAKNLETAISRMLNDDHNGPDTFKARLKSWGGSFFRHLKRMFWAKPEATAKEFYNHTYIKYLGENKSNPLPSYISPGTFSWVMVDLIKNKAKDVLDEEASALPDPQKVKKFLEEKTSIFLPPETRKQILALLEEAEGDLVKFRLNLERWFNETMERATEWYKRKMQTVLFGIGLTIAIFFNANTISMINRLSVDENARNQLVQLATQADQLKTLVPQSGILDTMELNRKLDTLLSVRSTLNTDIQNARGLISQGWDVCSDKGFFCYLGQLFNPLNLIGFILTGLAISLGAPFWFDILNKLVKVRTSVKGEAGEEKK